MILNSFFESKDDLSGSKAKSAFVARELQKIRAKHPDANSDIEALVKDELKHQQDSDRELNKIDDRIDRQRDLIRRKTDLDRSQDQHINDLENEIHQVEKETLDLEQMQARLLGANARLEKMLANMQDSKKVPAAEVTENNSEEKIGGRYSPEEWDDMVSRLGQLAKQGPRKTVYDPDKRVYKTVPVNKADDKDVDEAATVFAPGIENTAEYKQGFATGKLPVPYPEGSQQYASYYKGVIDKASPTLRQQGLTEEEIEENLRKWFKEKWVRFGPDGKIRGDCARGDDSEGKPKCLPQAKAHALGKKGRASAAARKRREDPNPERRGPAKNVATKKKSNEGVAEGSMKDLHIDLQDQQWDAIVGYVINGLKKNMDIGRIELNLYKYAGQELFDVDQELQDRGFRDIADLADHIRQHNGKYVPPTDFNLGKGVAEVKDVPHWRVEQSEATGRYYVVTGYTSKSRRVWKNKLGAVDFNKKADAEAKAQELNQGVAEGYQLDEGAMETISTLVKKLPGIGKYYQIAQQYKPQLVQILKTSKSGKEVKQKMEALLAQTSTPVAEAGWMKQLGGLALGGGSILSTMWMNAMGMIDGVLAHAAAGEVGGAVASGSILGLIPVTLMLFAAMLLFKGSKQSSDEKAQQFQAQRGQQGVAEGSTSHAELAKMAHDAYVAASRKGNGPMAAHYLKQYQKHKADAAKDKKGMAEGTGNIGSKIKALYQKIYDQGDDSIDYMYHESPVFAQIWDEYEGDLDSIIAEVDPSELQVIANELEAYLQGPGLAEGIIARTIAKGKDWLERTDGNPNPNNLINQKRKEKFDQLKKKSQQQRQQGVAEGNDDILGPQGNFAGDKKIELGADTVKKLQVGDTVTYFGEPARVVELNTAKNYARISAHNKTINVRLSDLKRTGQSLAEGQQQCPECGGPMFSNLLLAEKKDACYAKVRSRYKVWPSAYASGALVQCRKKGAANWGNKSESLDQEKLDEKWSEKYKRSINCNNPKGFSQRAHCQGRKKNEDLNEISLGDYSKKSAISKALAQIDQKFYPDKPGSEQTIAKRTRGLERAKARSDRAIAARTAKTQADAQAQDKQNLPALKDKLEKLKSQFDPNYEYSDDHGFWTKQRDISNQISSLKRQIARAEDNK